MDWNPGPPGPPQDRSVIDDRLATVLRAAIIGEASARTQFRQLIDILGSLAPAGTDAPQQAYDRLDALLDHLPPAQAAAMLAEPGLRLRNARLVAQLAEAGPAVGAATMAAARLDDEEWERLIPRLPITARGFLRHRRDLAPAVCAVLERLGVRDLVLTAPPAPDIVDIAADEISDPPHRDDGVGALLRRIEAFRSARQQAGGVRSAPQEMFSFDFTTDEELVIEWADAAMAPSAIGIALGMDDPESLAEMDRRHCTAMRQRQPLRGAAVAIDAGPAISGRWTMDAMPRFDRKGAFAGYRGRMRRGAAPVPAQETAANAAEADRIRQLLHELRTPVNAIQGFAEVIQQQVFGPAPNEYRALAAAVAVDAARLMAGFDELERLTRLELGSLAPTPGSTDLRRCVEDTLRRLDGAMRPRSAAMVLEVDGADFLVPLDEAETLQMIWRFLATLSGALAPAEAIVVTLAGDSRQISLRADLPPFLGEQDDLFAATAPARAQALSAGAFGSGFALRLARAEAAAAGGALHRTEGFIELVLPAAQAGVADGHGHAVL